MYDNVYNIKRPGAYRDFETFEDHVKEYNQKLNKYKDDMRESLKVELNDMSPAYDALRDEVAEIVGCIADISAHLQKGISVKFKVKENPLPRGLDMFDNYLKDLLSKLVKSQ